MTATGERQRASMIALLIIAVGAVVSNCATGVDPVRNGTGGASASSTTGAGGTGTGGAGIGGAGTGGFAVAASSSSTGGSTGFGGAGPVAASSTSVSASASVASSASSSSSSNATSSSTSAASSSTSTSSGSLTCLQNIPSSCPDCMTQNASDMPICEMYISCFEQNDCNPANACGQNSGVCGVNTIGGGNAPYQAAVTTYNCACP